MEDGGTLAMVSDKSTDEFIGKLAKEKNVSVYLGLQISLKPFAPIKR